jgi:hypothetical protein
LTNWHTGTPLNQSYLIKDLSSIIFGYAIMKQKRIKKGLLLFTFEVLFKLEIKNYLFLFHQSRNV